MNELAKPETWGELGPAMQVLNERQREFVRYLVTEKPGYGALTRAYRKAGYGKTSKAATLSKEAHHMSRDERIIAAIAEESRKVIRVGHPEAVAALFNLIRDPAHRDRARTAPWPMFTAGLGRQCSPSRSVARSRSRAT